VEFPGRSGKLPGCCADIARQLPGCFTGHRADAAPETTLGVARMVRGWCAAIRRIFCEHRRLKNLRGEASTLKPAQNCVGTSVGSYLRNDKQLVDWHGSLQANSTAQNS